MLGLKFRKPLSIRTRLFLVIFSAVVVAALCTSAVRYVLAQRMANQFYDKTLEVVALTISRDVLLTDGDILAEELLSKLVSALGDPVYYRVIGPGGRFVTGYSDGPNGSPSEDADFPNGVTVFYDGSNHGQPIRGVVLREFVRNARFDGWITVDVWQTVRKRFDLSLELLFQTVVIVGVIIVIMVGSLLAAISFGLRPLTDLSQAISQRTPRDLTPIQRRMPQELSPLIEALNDLIAKINSALRARDAFISDAAHQLRNPVSALASLLEVARTEVSETQRAQLLAEAHDSMQNLRRLTTQLLSLETLEGRANADHSSVDFVRIAAEAAARIAPDVIQAGAQIEFDAPDGPQHVNASETLLSEALDNMLDNALRYGLSEGGTLKIWFDASSELLRCFVADDGPGIAETDRQAIFERFRRGQQGGHKGSGLGLAISRRIAEQYLGSLTLEPSERGACFLFALPRQARV